MRLELVLHSLKREFWDFGGGGGGAAAAAAGTFACAGAGAAGACALFPTDFSGQNCAGHIRIPAPAKQLKT